MKPTLKSPDKKTLLVFGAHPDDIEFGCGGVIAAETMAGSTAHFIVCSRGEAGSNGTPKVRAEEAEHAASILKATIEFVDLDGDAHLQTNSAHAIKLAGLIRKYAPTCILATTHESNQHPDHARLGAIVRDAARIARYSGVHEIKEYPAHTVGQLFYYAVTTEGEPRDVNPLFYDVSSPDVIGRWEEAMAAHHSQAATRDYIELQMNRARLYGARAGTGYAIALYPNDPLVIHTLAQAGRGARHF